MFRYHTLKANSQPFAKGHVRRDAFKYLLAKARGKYCQSCSMKHIFVSYATSA